MDEASKKPSAIAAIGAGVAGIFLLAMLMLGFYKNRLPDWSPADVEAPGLRSETPRPWVDEAGFNLPPAGALPSLQQAMSRNPTLRTAVEEFSKKDDAEIFANYKKTDADITAILLLWSGAELNATQKTREGQDARVDRFLRQIYGMGGLVNTVNNPRTGRDPWPRLFAYYKLRLIAQTPGGAAPFAGKLTYDIKTDRVKVGGSLSRSFFADFAAFLKGRRDAADYRNNLLAYLAAVAPRLSAKDRQTLALVR